MDGYVAAKRPTERTKIGIFLIDRQEIFRRGLMQALGDYPEVELAGDSDFSGDIYGRLEVAPPDVVIVDIDLPSLSGLGIACQVARRWPGIATVILSPNPDDEQLFQAIKSGACAFISKDTTVAELVDVVHRASRKEYPINDSLMKRPSAAEKVLGLFQDLALRNLDGIITPLSEREMEVLRYVADGNPNKRIANVLNISEQTIKNHVTSIMRKLNANDRTHAVVLAIRSGLLNVEDGVKPDPLHTI